VKIILVGYDESEAAERALARAAELADATGARLVVACVTHTPRGSSTVPVLDPGAAPPVVLGSAGPAIAVAGEVPADRPGPEALARHQLERARLAIARRGVEADFVAATGDAADRLVELADERGADLIVVGSHEHGFLDRLLGRGVDETVAARSRRDVLLVR
jgi:nucleotide-binding universal stress UspA family protein